MGKESYAARHFLEKAPPLPHAHAGLTGLECSQTERLSLGHAMIHGVGSKEKSLQNKQKKYLKCFEEGICLHFQKWLSETNVT